MKPTATPPRPPAIPAPLTSLDQEEINVTGPYPEYYRAKRIAGLPPGTYPAAQQTLVTLYGPEDVRYQRFLLCRTRARFLRHKVTNLVTLSTNSCRLRWCPLCAQAKAYRIALRAADWLDSCTDRRLITLTLKHTSAPLSHQLDSLIKQFRALRRTNLWRSRVEGGVFFTQITRNSETNTWHPHLHILADADYIRQRDLAAAWQSITLTSKIVDIRAVRTVEHAVNYVSRYVATPMPLEKLTPDERIEMIVQIHHRRLVGTFGTAHAAGVLNKLPWNKNDWVDIGDYSVVSPLADTVPAALLIIIAWESGGPLDPTVDLSYITRDWPDVSHAMTRGPPMVQEELW